MPHDICSMWTLLTVGGQWAQESRAEGSSQKNREEPELAAPHLPLTTRFPWWGRPLWQPVSSPPTPLCQYRVLLLFSLRVDIRYFHFSWTHTPPLSFRKKVVVRGNGGSEPTASGGRRHTRPGRNCSASLVPVRSAPWSKASLPSP